MANKIRVGMGRIITMRYVMKNSEGQVLAHDRASFLYGSGDIMPGLEVPLTGLRTGEQRSFSLSPNDNSQLKETFHFDVIIDDVCWSSDLNATNELSEATNCPPGCAC